MTDKMNKRFICRIIYTDCRGFEGEKFAKLIAFVSTERLEKVLAQKTDEGKRLSLGAGLLEQRALSLCTEGSVIRYGGNGKPYIYPEDSEYLSITHSENIAALSLSSVPCGIDAQTVSKCDLRLAKRFFTEKEYQYIESFKSDMGRKKAFTRVWTRKESFVKLTGEGLSRPLGSFETNPRCKTSAIDGKRIYFSETSLGDCIVSVASEKPISIFLEEYTI